MSVKVVSFAVLIGLSWVGAQPIESTEENTAVLPLPSYDIDDLCETNEYYSHTAPGCESTCKDIYPQFCEKGISLCTCNPGYVRDSSYRCIRLEECVKSIDYFPSVENKEND